ncbi:MAG TPA: hypothetical protein DEA05_03820 [Rhodobacteraceae bacterium]|nr:hypothetical protein [Paracoccaceae bacterium]
MKARKPLPLIAVLAALAAGGWLLLAPGDGRGGLRLSSATAAPIEGAAPGTLGVFLTIETGDRPDRLLSVASPAAASVRLEGPTATPAIAAGSATALAPDGAFLRLTGVEGGADGQMIPVSLTFERAGTHSVQARLVAPQAQGEAPRLGLFGLGEICRVGEGEPAPRLSLRAAPEGDGWRVVVEAEEFEFTEHLLDGPHIPGTGHGHLYLDGLKLGRLYVPEATIGALPPGDHEIRVTLNTNDHRAYVVGETPVSASTTVIVD